MQDTESPLVTTTWLALHVDDPHVRVLDLRWGDNRAAYEAGHISGAAFVSCASDLTDTNHPVPDMLAPVEKLVETMTRLGIEDDTEVVAYDDMGVPMLAARIWWTLTYLGHRSVRVLDGGLRQWLAEGRPLSIDASHVEPRQFVPKTRNQWLSSKSEVLAALNTPGVRIVDFLNSDLYAGLGEKHRWGPRKGHIPSAVNIPFVANVDTSLRAADTAGERALLASTDRSSRLATASELASMYEEAGVAPADKVITYCGRGYAASVAALALAVAGYQNLSIYDGSWAEWSMDPALPVELGRAQ